MFDLVHADAVDRSGPHSDANSPALAPAPSARSAPPRRAPESPRPARGHRPGRLLRSVRGRVVLLVAALVVSGFLGTSLLVWRSYENERASVGRKLLNTARAIAAVADGDVAQSTMLLRTIAGSGALARGDLAEVDQLARGALNYEGRWFVLKDPSGQILVNTRVPMGVPLPRVASHEPGFAEAMRRHEEFVSNLESSALMHWPVVHIAVPYFEGETLRYTLHVTARAEELGRACDIDRYAPNVVVTVADRDKIIICRNVNGPKFVRHPISPDMLVATAKAQEGIVDSVTLDKVPVVAAFTRTKAGWWVLVGSPKREMYAGARHLLWWGLGGAALLSAIGIIMGSWISRALLRSMDGLATGAARLRDGCLPSERPLELDEPEDVAAAMRDSARALVRRTEILEAVNAFSQTLLAETDAAKIVRSVTDAAQITTGASYAAYFPATAADRREPELRYATSPHGAEVLLRLARRYRGTFLIPALRGGGAWRSGDVTQDVRCAAWHFAEGDAVDARSLLAVALRSPSGSVLGALVLGDPRAGILSDAAESTVTGLAAEAAIALANAELQSAVTKELAAKTAAETKLIAAQQSLERTVAERTASLRAAVAQMEEFSYTVSHDLRAPLRAIRGYADALEEDNGQALDANGHEYLRRIRRAADRLNRMTHDLLNYSRLASAHLEHAAVDIEKVIQTTIEQYPELSPVHATITIDGPIPLVMGHEPSLAQVHANLLTNAVKFSKPGQRPRVTVRAEARGRRVRIWIEDEGIGIPAPQQPHLFAVFQRGPDHQGSDSSGIGLAIVRKAVEKMGGACGVVSDGVSGSRFWIELDAA